jgi:uncharacterized protein (DUF58 family)
MPSKPAPPSSDHRSLFTNSAIWLRPNRNTIGLGAVLLAMWYAGASQSNGAAYLLCFMLAGIAIVSIVHAWANLRGVVLEVDPIRPVFAGEELIAKLHVRSEHHRAHFGLKVRAHDAARPAELGEVPAEGSASVELAVRATRRGFFPALRVQLASNFPLGFFTASRGVRLAQPYFIYPELAGTRPLPISPAPSRHARDGHRTGGDDFGGVRAWRTGESQRHIDWKAAARGQPLLVKQWFGDTDETLHFEWEMLSGLDTETRLSQLARWIVLAERDGASYGLRLPGFTREPARGEAHYHACLRALAQFDEPAPR